MAWFRFTEAFRTTGTREILRPECYSAACCCASLPLTK
jgi:hypothetical protein